MGQPTFIHTHVHTEYSISDGLSTVADLVRSVAQKGMPAVAVTERNNLFSVVKFYEEAVKNSIKPIIGCELSVKYDESSATVGHVVLLCMDQTGYRNLNRLVTKVYTEGQKGGLLYATYDWIKQYNQGLLALSGGLKGDIGRLLLEGKHREAEQAIAFWQSVFPQRYYLEVYITGRENEKAYLSHITKYAHANELPIVATNDVVFTESDDYEAHEAKVCIQNRQILDDRARKRAYSDQQYLKSAEEMATLFENIPSALENSFEIAKRCNLRLEFGQLQLPKFTEMEAASEREQLTQDVEKGLQQLLDSTPSIDPTPYRQRVAYELGIIQKMNYEGYFLIVADFIRWAKREGIPVGPGRGSGAGSLVAYLIGITEIDPLRYDLLFERFLNPERISMPDFDIDFCIEGRDHVIAYVAKRYGNDKVSQINTFGSYGAKVAVRDISRVLGVPHNHADKIVQMIPDRLNITLGEALNESKDLRDARDSESKVRQILEQAQKIEGLSRNPGRHAGGIVISPKPLVDYTALYCEEGEDNLVAQFDMKDIEKVGLVKFDFLGLKTLTVIHKAVQTLKEQGIDVDFEHLDLADKKTYELLQRAETSAVFQLESEGMRELIKKLRPDKFDDLVALLALYRPGPLQAGMGDVYAECKNGATVNYIHPALETVLKPTYGVILYQEQVIQIARELSGYSSGAADILRRAMGKKDPEEMARQRETFVAGAKGKGIQQAVANQIFDLMEHFAGYGFNKSHSVAYAMIAYRTAWLKANYPDVFMAAVMSQEMSNTDKLVFLINECRAMGIRVLPPNINRSVGRFTVTPEGILYGLGAIKNIPNYLIREILEDRAAHGDYESFADFCLRVIKAAKKNIRKSSINILIRSSALDVIGERGGMLHHCNDIFMMAEQEVRNMDIGQSSLFNEEVHSTKHLPTLPKSEHTEELGRDRLLAMECEALGLYLTGHPIDVYQSEIDGIVQFRLGDLLNTSAEKLYASRDANASFWVAGAIMDIQRKYIRGKRVSFFSLDDGSGRVDLALFDQDYENCKEMLSHNDIVLVEIYRLPHEIVRAGSRWRARKILELDEARLKFAKHLFVTVDMSHGAYQLVDKLKESLTPYCDGKGCPVVVSVAVDGVSASLVLGENWKVKPYKALLDSLRHVAEVDDVQVSYSRIA